MVEKTLIGKNGYLFLKNDESKELEIHCNNRISPYKIVLPDTKYFLTVYPDKSVICKKYLPDEYISKYRPGIEKYKKVLNENMLDCLNFLDETDYYKTDTHINLKGNFYVYKEFIKCVNSLFNLNIEPKEIIINKKEVNSLSELCIGKGDLTWEKNLGKQILDSKKNIYYYYEELFYPNHTILKNDIIQILSYDFSIKNEELDGQKFSWNIVSKYIVYNKNETKKNKIVIFHDSFLLSILPLFFNIFNEIYFIKNQYVNCIKQVEYIKPDFIFEFRVERFLF